MKTLRGLPCLTINEYIGWAKIAAEVWLAVLHDEYDWEGIRACLTQPAASPFILRQDYDHVQVYHHQPENIYIVSYRTPEAYSQIALLQQAAIAEDEDRFSEYFYTALEL